MLGREREQSDGTPLMAEEVAAAPAGTPIFNIVGSTARLEGKFEIADSLRVECEVGGELTVGNKLVIGPQGIVRADVQTVNAVIMGQFEGSLVASGDVEITPTGRVSGSIETDSLVIAKGGFFNGNVTRIEDGGAAGKPSRPVYLLEGRRASAGR